jgi:uncharacterized protein
MKDPNHKKNNVITKKNILKKLSKEKKYMQSMYGVEKIGIFGSYARDVATEESDIDFYVEFKKNTFDNVSGLWVYLEELYGDKVDLLHRHKRSHGAIFDQIKQEVVYG